MFGGKLTSLLIKTLRFMKTNRQISKEIKEGKKLTEIALKHSTKPAKNRFEPIIVHEWWIETLFRRAKLSVGWGAFAVFVVLLLPTLVFVPYLIGSSSETLIGFALDCFGFLVVLVILIPLHFINKGLRDLIEKINEIMPTKYVAPKSLIAKDNRCSNESLKKLDKDYQDFYIKPVLLRSLRSGYDLSFSKTYQIGCGTIAAAAYASLILLKQVFGSLPNRLLEFWTPPFAAPAASFYSVYQLLVDIFTWFLIGMLVWSLFVTFLITLQNSAQTISIRPYEPVRQFFQPTTQLVLWMSFALSAIIAWSTYSLVWSVLPSNPAVRQSTINFMEIALTVLIPILILSLLVPFVSIHRGMQSSCERALCIKGHELEELKENPLSNFDRNLNIQTHLIGDYQLILAKPQWSLTSPQITEGIGTILLPIVIFLVGLLLGKP